MQNPYTLYVFNGFWFFVSDFVFDRVAVCRVVAKEVSHHIFLWKLQSNFSAWQLELWTGNQYYHWDGFLTIDDLLFCFLWKNVKVQVL